MRTTRNGVSLSASSPPFFDDVRQAEDVPVALLLVDVGLAQRRDPVDQHALGVGVDDAGLEAVAVVLGGGDLVEAVIGEEIRPGLQRVAVDAADIGGLQREDALERDGSHPMTLNAHMRAVALPEAAHRGFGRARAFAAVPAPPISTTARSSPAAATPRCTKPPTAPSSIET